MYGLTSQIVEAEKVLGALLQASGYASGFDPTRRSPSFAATSLHGKHFRSPGGEEKHLFDTDPSSPRQGYAATSFHGLHGF